MFTTNDTKTTEATHQAWEKAMRQRDSLAIQAARALHNGLEDHARELAAASMSFDADMVILEKKLA